jgi:ribosome recycling factor
VGAPVVPSIRALSTMHRRPLLDLSDQVGRKKGANRDDGNKGKGSPQGGAGGTAAPAEDMSEREVLEKLKEKMAFSLDRFKKDLAQMQTGRASPDLLSKILVDTYEGATEPLSKVAQIAMKDHQTLMVNVFDPNLVKAVAEAIAKADLQLNPQVTGSSVRVGVPRITQEYREMMAKKVKETSEKAKQILRGHRHDVLKLAKNGSTFSKDEMYRLEENLTKITQDYVKLITTETDNKVNSVMKNKD